jgi:hypothetical protein
MAGRIPLGGVGQFIGVVVGVGPFLAGGDVGLGDLAAFGIVSIVGRILVRNGT